jgi:His-Xaa-Ser system protein HxsD
MQGIEGSAVQYRTDGTAALKIDRRIFPDNAVKAATYKFAKQAAFTISIEEECWLRIEILPNAGCTETETSLLVRAVLNEIIDEDLRVSIRHETEATRNLILAQAFSKTRLI